MPTRLELTEREQQVGAWASVVVAIVGLCTVIAVNVTGGSWRPVVAGAIVTGVMVGAITAWIAHNHRLGLVETVVAVARRPKHRR